MDQQQEMQWKYHQIHVKRFAKSEYIYIIYGWKRGSLKAFHLITSSNSEEVPTGPTQLQEVLANQVSTRRIQNLLSIGSLTLPIFQFFGED